MTATTFPSSVGGDNSTVSDDNNATTGLGNGGHRTRFVPALGQIVAIAQFVVNLAQGIPNGLWAPVKAVATSNITLSGTQTVDGVALSAGDRCFVVGQTTASQNGLYVVAAGAWTRATDADVSAEFVAGKMLTVQQGTTYAGTQWQLTTTGAITLGTTALTFTQMISGTTSNTFTKPQTFSDATSPIISAKAGPSAGQQHGIPAVASDTFALLAATQTFSNKTLTSPAINTPTISGGSINNTPIGATTQNTGAFTTLSSSGLASLASAAIAGVLSLALGSASAPGLAFTGDTNTGIFSPGADQISRTTGGVERDRIDASGNVTSFIPGQTGLYPEFVKRAWVLANGTTILGSGNVTSVSVVTTGQYRMSFVTAMPDSNFQPDLASDVAAGNASGIKLGNRTTTTADWFIYNSAGSLSAGGIMCCGITR